MHEIEREMYEFYHWDRENRDGLRAKEEEEKEKRFQEECRKGAEKSKLQAAKRAAQKERRRKEKAEEEAANKVCWHSFGEPILLYPRPPKSRRSEKPSKPSRNPVQIAKRWTSVGLYPIQTSS
jgi:hypothetical protein